MKYYVIFLLVFLKVPSAETPLYQNLWVVWNIGQGQWVTHITADECIHFDAGGEPGTFKKIRAKLIAKCGQKQNKILLSHWDMDHYLHIPFLAKTVPRLCWQYKPSYGITKKSVQKIIDLKIKNCAEPLKINFWVPYFAKTTNDSSAVFISDSILIPGDSPTSQERLWAKNLPNIKTLILAHHGSRTSTSEALLTNLPSLKWTISSARWQKYHHPHPDTLKRLYKKNLPLLRTEDWGNIWFEPSTN